MVKLSVDPVVFAHILLQTRNSTFCIITLKPLNVDT